MLPDKKWHKRRETGATHKGRGIQTKRRQNLGNETYMEMRLSDRDGRNRPADRWALFRTLLMN
jgi:hypothetical protein